jgi:hypothetical protein
MMGDITQATKLIQIENDRNLLGMIYIATLVRTRTTNLTVRTTIGNIRNYNNNIYSIGTYIWCDRDVSVGLFT